MELNSGKYITIITTLVGGPQAAPSASAAAVDVPPGGSIEGGTGAVEGAPP
jgi:hypothetical protein